MSQLPGSFHHLPPVSLYPWELPLCPPGSVRALALKEEISKMLQRGALESVDQPGPGFNSHLFLVQKVIGGWRPVIDLSTLNCYVILIKFQMETVASILGSIWKGDWMFSINCKDMYFQIPIQPKFWPYLWFMVKGQVFQFRVLCFRLSTAP